MDTSTLHQCPECHGHGEIGRWDQVDICANCDGTGWLDEHGEPYYPEPELQELTKEQQ